jgi:hypothetical protein
MTGCKAALSVLFVCALARAEFKGRVTDAATRQPIPAAIVTCGVETAITAADGSFHIADTPTSLGVRAAGYRQTTIAPAAFHNAIPEIRLQPFRPKALYLSFYGIGSHALRDPALALAAQAGLNALVIDVKGDRGFIPYPSSVAVAASVRANSIITVKDIRGLVQDLHARGFYLIARIVVFKDNPLAEARPDLAVKTAGNGIWRDREGLAWVDPSKKEAWTYSIDIAVEAARNGFDEIQFDYVRFPDAKGVAYSVPNTEQNRVAALSGFLTAARASLVPLNVYLAADVFGYIPWNTGDTDIGQRIEKLAPLVDYLCPMLYPSGFQFGIPGFRIPVEHPYEIVRLSLDRAAQRSGLAPVHFRPWLQAFRDYAFDKRVFGPKEIAAQIRASQDFGSDGWMLWNPHNVYSNDGL